MENPSEKVYECTLAVEAHMICDLLARAGITARVDGEFLAGAGGELPLGSSIKVRVDPSRAVEARKVIDEWERMQPPGGPTPAPKRPTMRSPLWFFCGLVIGAGIMFLALRGPSNENYVDWDGDGYADETYKYSGQVHRGTDFDRNADGKTDLRWINDIRGVPSRYEADDNFDGRFEIQGEVERGMLVQTSVDMNGDGKPEQTEHMIRGVLRTINIYDDAGSRIVIREHYGSGHMQSREFDADGDGVFERRVEFDRFGEPLTK